MIGTYSISGDTSSRSNQLVALEAWDKPNTVSSQAYAVQFLGETAVSVTWGMAVATNITIREIMG